MIMLPGVICYITLWCCSLCCLVYPMVLLFMLHGVICCMLCGVAVHPGINITVGHRPKSVHLHQVADHFNFCSDIMSDHKNYCLLRVDGLLQKTALWLSGLMALWPCGIWLMANGLIWACGGDVAGSSSVS